ncbi:hypothetical protein FQA39_LY18020 [Lamprigera yunnana]|nr:hypothetical protein FQA39_LY18020 [Lamprigera yunnana]
MNAESVVSSKFTEALLASEKEENNVKQPCKNKILFVCALALLVIVPIYFLTSTYCGVGYQEVVIPQRWVEQAVHNNNTGHMTKTSTGYRLVCYYMFPSSNGSSILSPKDLDALLCTHVIVGFASIVNNSIYLNERNAAVFQHVVAMKASNADLKVLLSIGGAGTESGFPQMVINHGTRKEFIKSVDELVQKYECDGIDLDWEFPNKVPSEDDKQRMHFTQLLYELRKETNRQHKHKFLISVAVAAPRFFVDLSYDVSYMNNYVDFINLMTYDFHFYTYLTPVTGVKRSLVLHQYGCPILQHFEHQLHCTLLGFKRNGKGKNQHWFTYLRTQL